MNAYDKILAEVAAEAQITVDDLKGPSRKRAHAHPRQKAMWRLRHELPASLASYPNIARRFGDRDHTTVLHGCRAYGAREGLGAPR